MVEAVLADLATIGEIRTTAILHPTHAVDVPPGVEVVAGDESALEAAALRADAALIVAPETGGVLAKLVDRAARMGVKILGPSSEIVRRYGDKLAAAGFLDELTIPTTLAPTLPAGNGPVVIKPREGAGSLWTAIAPRSRAGDAFERLRNESAAGDFIIQPFFPGVGASVTVVRRPGRPPIVLPPVQRALSTVANLDHQVVLIGAEKLEPLAAPEEGARALRLACRLLERESGLTGYFGIDLILGERERNDRICEVNPRLTSSYTLYRQFLGPAIMAWLIGFDVPQTPPTWPASIGREATATNAGA